MSTLNPYIPPTGNVADTFSSSEEFGTINILSATGRLGRIRFLAWSMGVSMIGMIAIALVAGIASFLPGSAGGFASIAAMALGYIAMIYVSILLLIQRSHDMGKSGWFALVGLIPLVSLIFLFLPGTQGANEYGAPPPPNSKALTIVVTLVLAIGVAAIIASIVLPALGGM